MNRQRPYNAQNRRTAGLDCAATPFQVCRNGINCVGEAVYTAVTLSPSGNVYGFLDGIPILLWRKNAVCICCNSTRHRRECHGETFWVGGAFHLAGTDAAETASHHRDHERDNAALV